MRLIPHRPASADYYELLKRIHASLRPRTYAEIGVRHGESLTLARRCDRAIGIDPSPTISHPLSKGTRVFAMTSDTFFATRDLYAELSGCALDLAFIDGMHLFEFALRDFIHLERFAGPHSCILIHDCYPIDAVTAARERTTQVWSGDVWKLIVCLKKYRPDLNVATIDVPPTGLGVVRNLNPNSTALARSLAEIQAEFLPWSLERVLDDKARQLNRIDNDWGKIRNLFPSVGGIRLFAGLGKSPSKARQRAIESLGVGAKPMHRARIGGSRPKALGVLLCYNDADVLPDAIEALLTNRHDLVVWDHGSNDDTARVLDRYVGHIRERKFIPRSFDFYKLYAAMSMHLIQTYRDEYDWISWPDEDEILEGPSRDRSYFDWLAEVVDSEFDWIQFRNFNFWFTEEDDPAIASPTKRVTRYCLFPDCSPRIRAWRASATNLRHFNHNPAEGRRYPAEFNLRHYPMRSEQQMMRRLSTDRADIERGSCNNHYRIMKGHIERLALPAHCLHKDDGRSELDQRVIFDWHSVYRHSAEGATVRSRLASRIGASRTPRA